MARSLRSIVPLVIVSAVVLATIAGTAGGATAVGKPPKPSPTPTPSPTPPPTGRAKWTVMVYMSGDNDLEASVPTDIDTELAPTGSSTNVQVVALADRAPGGDSTDGDWTSTKLFHVTPGMTATPANAVADWGERNMADPQTLVQFVNWTRTNYPADHYALYLWGHGWSWHPGYVLADDTSGDTMDYTEMKPIMNSLGFIDVVAYDGCNMQSVEIQSLWHGHATALVASQEFVGWEGIQYDQVLAGLAATPTKTADQVAVASAQSATAEKTFSAVAVDSRWDAFRTAVDGFGTAIKNDTAERTAITRAFTNTRDMWQAPIDKDLYDMAYEINRNVTNATLKTKAQGVMSAMSSVVLYERHSNQYADTHGITIYLIQKAADKGVAWYHWPYYTNTDWAATTQWDEFLNAWAI